MAIPASTASSAGFWTVTFLGIFGTVSGIIGTLSALFGLWISFRIFKYNQPSISLEIVELSYPKLFKDAAEAKDRALRAEGAILDPLYAADNPKLYFDLYININNETGGEGSIQKPRLIIKNLHGKDLYSINPTTSRIKSNPLQMDDLGENYYLRGGDRKDREHLYYRVGDSIQDYLMKDKFHFRYYIGYKDNSGKYHEKEIDSGKIKAA